MSSRDDRSGDWQGLHDASQAPRYACIARLLTDCRADRKVLDVGCGEGVLRDWLPQGIDYTGIEPSAMAVRSAAEVRPSAMIVHGSAESFESRGETYDGVVFNEMLYYTADPLGLLSRYAAMLSDGGVIACSVFQKPRSLSVRRLLRHWIDRRRPVSNAHCSQMVRVHMLRNAWSILDDREVAVPGTSLHWKIWVARPPKALCEAAAYAPPAPDDRAPRTAVV